MNANNLFYEYLRLYPGKQDYIMNAIKKGIMIADSEGLTGKDRNECIEAEILDALD